MFVFVIVCHGCLSLTVIVVVFLADRTVFENWCEESGLLVSKFHTSALIQSSTYDTMLSRSWCQMRKRKREREMSAATAVAGSAVFSGCHFVADFSYLKHVLALLANRHFRHAFKV